MRVALPLSLLALGLAGCSAADIVTLPVKAASTAVGAAGSAVDAVTTSQAEADQKLGRKIRKQEECMGREQKKARKHDREPDYSKCERD
ncbi:hypothetical protein [Sphingomonas parva]|nr:hypothetical protein [Sphingomonas parva]